MASARTIATLRLAGPTHRSVQSKKRSLTACTVCTVATIITAPPRSSNATCTHDRNAARRLVFEPNLYPQRRQASDTAAFKDGGLRRTALYELHVKRGAKMVPFGGYSMPVQYNDLGVGESHEWTRKKASLFDVGHMYDVALLNIFCCLILTLIASL